MKKILNLSVMVLVLSAILPFVTSCSDDDNNGMDPENSLSFTELPGAVQLFVQNHFDENSVELILRNTSEGTEGYNISVKGYKIDFDKDGLWEKIEAKDKGALPANIVALIPASISGHVESNYPGRGIYEIKKKEYGYKVELAGKPDVELNFDFGGNVFKIDEDDNPDDEKISIETLPAVSQDFLERHFAAYTVEEVRNNKDSYEVKYTDKTEVEFYISGEWKRVEIGNKNALPESVIALLPEKAVSYIASTYPGKVIKEITNKQDIFEVELYKDIDITFDKDGNVWRISDDGEDENNSQSKITFESLPQPVKDFVVKYFPDTKVLYVNRTYREYKIGLVDGTRMDFTMDNQIQAIVSVRGEGIPNGAVLPVIANYVGKNYPDKRITVYIRQYGGYFVELWGYPVRKLFFDLNGNFLRTYN
ncbi:MAG: PepSY-like domain-containing protein [Tannerella sp.]|jgi:hypothetical protein|nr:PepSY-like domain-containing protein [Tannerella sp.]